MLVLSRHLHEAIILRQNGRIVATITVEEIQRGKVRIGVEADMGIEVNRQEIDAQKFPEDEGRVARCAGRS